METLKTFDNHQAAFGIFRKKSEVSAARVALQASGFSRSDISVLYPPHGGAQDFEQQRKTLIQSGAVMGSIAGGFVAAILGLLVSRQILMPWIQFNSTVVNTLTLLAAALVAGALVGAGIGALIGIGTPESPGNRYGEYVESGGILMSVRVEDRDQARKAKTTLEETGAQDINFLREDRGWQTVYDKVSGHH